MRIKDLYRDWKEYAGNGWLRWRRGEGPAKGSAILPATDPVFHKEAAGPLSCVVVVGVASCPTCRCKAP